MAINSYNLLKLHPIDDMESTKIQRHGVSFGLSEAGYDIRIKQRIRFRRMLFGLIRWVEIWEPGSEKPVRKFGRFALASTIERFTMPPSLVGIVHDKSTWARRTLSVFNTVIEPGWCGYLTLELVYNGNTELDIAAGSGIAQVIFHELSVSANYNGKYQNQENKPVEAIASVDKGLT